MLFARRIESINFESKCRTRRAIYDCSRYNVVKNEFRALARKLRADFETNIKTKGKHLLSYVKSKMKTRDEIESLTKLDGWHKAESLDAFFSSVFTVEEL